MNKLFSLSYLFLLISTQGNSQTYSNAIRLSTAYNKISWGETTSFNADIDFQPGISNSKYQLPLLEGKTLIKCTSTGGRSTILYSNDGGLTPTTTQHNFPYKDNFKLAASSPLEIGIWKCKMASQLITKLDRKTQTIALHSNEVEITVLPPSLADESVIREAGLWEIYQYQKNGFKDDKGLLRSVIAPGVHQIGNDYFETYILKHPESQYYCRVWTARMHDALDFRKSTESVNANYSQYDAYWGPNEIAQKRLEALDNLEKYNCKDAKAVDFEFWRVVSALENGEFEKAISAAKRGKSLSPDAGQKAYFERLLKTPTENAYLNQFKSIRSPKSNAKSK